MLGGLGSGRFSPVLVEVAFPYGGHRLAVLHRPAPPEAAALARTPGRWVVVEEGRALTDQGSFALSPWIPGWDGDGLAELRPPPRALLSLLREIVWGLGEAAEAGVSHGALTGGSVRVTPWGAVRLLGFRGEGSDDLVSLAHLAEEWAEASGHLSRLLPDLAGCTPAEAEGALTERIDSMSGPTLAEWLATLADPAPALTDHPLKGTILRESGPPPATPAKVRVAAVAALTLVLGWVSGAVWFSGAPPTEVEIRCDAHQILARGAGVQVSAPTCEVGDPRRP